MKNKHSTLRLVISIIITLIFIGLFIFLIRVIKNKNNFTSAAMIVLKEGIERKENILVFSERINEVKKIQEKINGYFINEDKIDTFVDYLEKLGVGIGSEVIVKSINISDKEKNIVTFNISLSGEFNPVIKTINLLENIPYQINITKLYLNKITYMKSLNGEKELEVIEWEANITFKATSLH
jgi:hypothetical protein